MSLKKMFTIIRNLFLNEAECIPSDLFFTPVQKILNKKK